MLTLKDIKEENIKRQQTAAFFACKNWTLTDWMTALTGEVGEAANIIKKIRRGDYELEDVKEELADEFADILSYLDVIATKADINLDGAYIKKFDKTSERVGYERKMTGNYEVSNWNANNSIPPSLLKQSKQEGAEETNISIEKSVNDWTNKWENGPSNNKRTTKNFWPFKLFHKINWPFSSTRK